MKLIFIRKIVEYYHQLLSRKEVFLLIAKRIMSILGKDPIKEISVLNLEKRVRDSIYVEQVRRLLISENRTVGKPFSIQNPDIRIVYIDSFVGAFIYFLHLCDQRLLTYQQVDNHLYCKAVFPDGSGELLFTDKVRCHNKAVIAVLKVRVPVLKPKISEIRFEVKLKK